ncbi:MAG: flagellar hook-associated protein FlgL [Nitrospiraceae bacterium]|nr:flagellar hook-associated protein FlgL [Nitrospiraceae bacterium]
MRTTSFTIYDQISRALQQTMADLSAISNRLSSGKKISRPSDDVIGTIKALDYKLSIDLNDRYQSNIADVRNRFDFTDKVLSSASDTLSSLGRIASQGASGELSADERTAFAGQVIQYRDILTSLANSKYLDKYVFSGYKTDTQAFDPATFAYQGDSGISNVPIDQNTNMPINFAGNSVFSLPLTAAQTVQLPGGGSIQYTAGAPGTTTTNVAILDAGNNIVDQFSYDNFMQMADIMATALNANDTRRISALVQPLLDARTHIQTVQAENGVRENAIDDQNTRLTSFNLSLQNSLSATEDADMTETITDLQKTSVALRALQQASARILSQSLLDFLK